MKDRARRARIVAALCSAVWTSSLGCCRAHVELPPRPGPAADLDDVAAYRYAMRPVGRAQLRTTTVVVDAETGTELEHANTREALRLNGGALVHHPEDLIPVVGEDSECGVAARKAGDARRANEAWGFAGTALVGGSFFVLVAQPERRLGLEIPLSFPAAVVLAGGAATSLLVMAATHGDVIEHKRRAFDCYERALR